MPWENDDDGIAFIHSTSHHGTKQSLATCPLRPTTYQYHEPSDIKNKRYVPEVFLSDRKVHILCGHLRYNFRGLTVEEGL